MSQLNYTLTLPLGTYSGAKFAGRCDEYSISIAKGSVARNVDISGLKFAKVSAPGVDLTGLKAEASSIITLDVPGATLGGAQMRNATIGMKSNFYGANIQSTEEQQTDFTNMNAKGVNFSATQFTHALFDGSNLESAKFEGSQLKNVEFRHNSLQGASFRNAVFRNVDLIIETDDKEEA